MKEGEYPAGTFVVRMDQPYRGFALDLLTPQKYPADKAPYDAYDDVAWSLPVALGVEVKAIERRGGARRRASRPSPSASRYRARSRATRRVLPARATSGRRRCSRRACGSPASRSKRPRSPSRPAARTIRRGRGSSRGQAGLRSALENVAADLAPRRRQRGERARRGAPPRRPAAPRRAADLERHAVGRLGAHDLRRREDPVHADHGRGRAQGRACASASTSSSTPTPAAPEGHRDRDRPEATRRSPSPRRRSSRATARRPRSPDITGGFGWTGIENLEEFVRERRRAGDARRRLRRCRSTAGIARDVRRATREGARDTPAASCACASAAPTTRSPTATRRPRRSSARTRRSTPCARSTRGASCSSGARSCPKDDEDEKADEKADDEKDKPRSRRSS